MSAQSFLSMADMGLPVGFPGISDATAGQPMSASGVRMGPSIPGMPTMPGADSAGGMRGKRE